MTPDERQLTKLLHERAVRQAAQAPEQDFDYFCGHCGEHSEGDILEVYLPEDETLLDFKRGDKWVAALHVDTCRPHYPFLVADGDR